MKIKNTIEIQYQEFNKLYNKDSKARENKRLALRVTELNDKILKMSKQM